MRFVEIKLPKSILVLREEEYLEGLKRGKGLNRSRRLKERLEKREAEKEAGR